MDNRRRNGNRFEIFLTIIIAILFAFILALVAFGHELKDGPLSSLTNWGTVLLNILTLAAGYVWGSSKGSAMKDELNAMNAPKPPAFTTTTAQVSTLASTEPLPDPSQPLKQ